MEKTHKFTHGILIRLACIIVAVTNYAVSSEALSQNTEFLNAPSPLWTLIENSHDEYGGHVRLHKNKWLMNFLHWRPLTSDNKVITPEYVRGQLLNFWGPNMAYFTLTGVEGPTMVNGHKAYRVDGLFRDMVATRFIIWNCLETERQYTADLNINLRVETPEVYLGIQELMVSTICCHGDCSPKGGTVLPDHVHIPDFNISFDKPEGWKTSLFEPENWFPNGADQLSGTLWTLVPDAEKQIDYLWLRRNEPYLADEIIGEFFDLFKGKDGLDFTKLEVEKLETGSGMWLLEGHYKVMKEADYKDRYLGFSDMFKFKGTLWKEKDDLHLLLVSILQIETVWGIAVDLEPSEKMLDDLFILATDNMVISIPGSLKAKEDMRGPVDQDGNIYTTIRVGDLEWMAENLRTTKFSDGTPIQADLEHGEWRANRNGAMAIFPHTLVNGVETSLHVLESYGALYNWYAVNNSRGLCPTGWRVPTDGDWTTMTSHLISMQGGVIPENIGNHLKSCRQMRSTLGDSCDTHEHPRWFPDPDHFGTDAFGFGGLPGGYRFAYGDFYNLGSLVGFWSATADSRSNAWVRFLRSNSGQLNRLSYDKASGFSVRCVRDLN